jgi:hypothetical protein
MSTSIVNKKETIIEMNDNDIKDYRSTGLSDAIFFLILGFVHQHIYILPAVLAFMYSFKAKQNLEKQKFEKYEKYFCVANHLNRINFFLLFLYIAMRFVFVLSIVFHFEIIKFNINDSIFFSFLSSGLQK